MLTNQKSLTNKKTNATTGASPLIAIAMVTTPMMMTIPHHCPPTKTLITTLTGLVINLALVINMMPAHHHYAINAVSVKILAQLNEQTTLCKTQPLSRRWPRFLTQCLKMQTLQNLVHHCHHPLIGRTCHRTAIVKLPPPTMVMHHATHQNIAVAPAAKITMMPTSVVIVPLVPAMTPTKWNLWNFVMSIIPRTIGT